MVAGLAAHQARPQIQDLKKQQKKADQAVFLAASKSLMLWLAVHETESGNG